MRIMTRKINLKIEIEKTAERHPVPVFGTDYKVIIYYKNVQFPELNVEEKLIKISLPNKYKKQDSERILDIAIDKMYEQIAKVEMERAMEKARHVLGFAPEDYEIRKMPKALGQCIDKRIIINPEIVKYSRELIDYVVIHQFCHLKYKTHSKKFLELLSTYIPNYEQFENELLRIQSNK